MLAMSCVESGKIFEVKTLFHIQIHGFVLSNLFLIKNEMIIIIKEWKSILVEYNT